MTPGILEDMDFGNDENYNYELLEDENEQGVGTNQEEGNPLGYDPDTFIYYGAVYMDGSYLIGEGKSKQYTEVYKIGAEQKVKELQFQMMMPNRIMSDTSHDLFDLFLFKQDKKLFLCCAHKAFPKRISENFLRDTAASVKELGGNVKAQAIINTIKAQLNKHNDKENDTYCRGQRKVKEAARDAKTTLEKIFARGKHMDTLMSQTSAIVNDTYQGKKQSKRLKWENKFSKTCAIIVALVLVMIFIIGTISLLAFRIGTFGDPRDYLGIKHDPNDKTVIEKGKDYLHKGENYVGQKIDYVKHMFNGENPATEKTPETATTQNTKQAPQQQANTKQEIHAVQKPTQPKEVYQSEDHLSQQYQMVQPSEQYYEQYYE